MSEAEVAFPTSATKTCQNEETKIRTKRRKEVMSTR